MSQQRKALLLGAVCSGDRVVSLSDQEEANPILVFFCCRLISQLFFFL